MFTNIKKTFNDMFSTKTVNDPQPSVGGNAPQVAEAGIPAEADNAPQDTAPANELPLTPTVYVTPESKPVTMAHDELQKIETNDLGSWGMDACIRTGGTVQGLQTAIEIVAMNYLMEVKAREEKMKSEMVRDINNINNHIIGLNNEIAVIREFHIPEKKKEVENLQAEMKALESDSRYDLQTDLGSETYTILATARARSREIIRKLQARIIELKTVIEQEGNRINTMRKQLEKISLLDPEIFSFRLNIFFQGWLSGLEGSGAPAEEIRTARNFFQQYKETSPEILIQQ